jgi:hypothetical protein
MGALLGAVCWKAASRYEFLPDRSGFGVNQITLTQIFDCKGSVEPDRPKLPTRRQEIALSPDGSSQ